MVRASFQRERNTCTSFPSSIPFHRASVGEVYEDAREENDEKENKSMKRSTYGFSIAKIKRKHMLHVERFVFNRFKKVKQKFYFVEERVRKKGNKKNFYQ